MLEPGPASKPYMELIEWNVCYSSFYVTFRVLFIMLAFSLFLVFILVTVMEVMRIVLATYNSYGNTDRGKFPLKRKLTISSVTCEWSVLESSNSICVVKMHIDFCFCCKLRVLLLEERRNIVDKTIRQNKPSSKPEINKLAKGILNFTTKKFIQCCQIWLTEKHYYKDGHWPKMEENSNLKGSWALRSPSSFWYSTEPK